MSVQHGPVHTAIARMIAVDDAGGRHEQQLTNVNSENDEWETTFVMGVPQGKIKMLILEAREFDKFVVARDIGLTPDARTTPKIEVTDAARN